MEASSPPAWALRVGRWVRTGAAAGLVLAGLEALVEPAAALPAALALGLAAGAIAGLPLGLVDALCAAIPRRLRAVALGGLGALAGLWVAWAIGALAHLFDDRAALGWGALVVFVLSGALTGLSVFAAGRFAERPLRARLTLAIALLFVATAGAFGAVEVLLLSAYPPAQQAVVVGSWAILSAALSPLDPWPRMSSRSRALLALGAAGLVAMLFVPAVSPEPAFAAAAGRPRAGPAVALLRRLTDVDGDGASGLFAGGDCQPWDPRVSPGTPEELSNGIDEDCSGGDATGWRTATGFADPEQLPVPPSPSPLSVVLITVDALRADHTAPYGYGRATTPALARFARAAVVYERAYTTGGWTSLALASLFRGVHPRRMRWRLVAETVDYRLIPAPEVERSGARVRAYFTLPDDPRRSLAFWLSWRGMRTAAVVDDGRSEFLEPALGLAPDFDRYELVEPGGDERVAGAAIEALRELRAGGSPYFLWVHFFGPHAPDERHPSAPDFGSRPVDGYDHEVAYLDEQLGRLLGAIDAAPDPPAVLITADHGETLRADGRAHGLDLFDATVRIPMLLRAPGLAAGRVSAPVSLVDVAPTVLALTETPVAPVFDGVDLRRAPPERVVFSDVWRYGPRGDRYFDLTAASDSRHRAILDMRRQALFVHAVGDHPQSPTNIVGRADRDDLIGTLRDYASGPPLPTP